MQTTVLILALAILVIIAYGDIRTRRIPNALAAAIAMLGIVRVILGSDLAEAGYTLAAAAAVLAGAFLLFSHDIVGGGDAKLVAATALLIGYHDLFGFFFLMSLCGMPLALAVLARDKLGPWQWRRSRRPGTPPLATAAAPMPSTVPYGAAIAGAGMMVLILRTF